MSKLIRRKREGIKNMKEKLKKWDKENVSRRDHSKKWNNKGNKAKYSLQKHEKTLQTPNEPKWNDDIAC